MSTVTSGQSVDEIARILTGARAVAHRLWETDPHREAAMSPNPSDLAGDIRNLFALLAARRVSYVLVGDVALLKYIESRNTEDIDLLLSLAALESMPEIEITDRNRDFARGRFGDVRVDVLLTRNPVFALVQKNHATVHRFSELAVPCATVEELLLLKLYALPDLYAQSRFQRAMLYENDIAMLAQKYQPNLRATLETLRPFVDARQHEELGRIIEEIEAKVRRMGK